MGKPEGAKYSYEVFLINNVSQLGKNSYNTFLKYNVIHSTTFDFMV